MPEKKVSEAIEYRRSVRIFDDKKDIDSALVKKCLEQAILAPNSSNLQLWEFYHVTSNEEIKKIAKACFNQPAARTAKQFVIPVVRKDLYMERIASNVAFIKSEYEKSKKKTKKKPRELSHITKKYYPNFMV